VQFYKDVIKRLLAKGLTPAVTMYHWDLPDDYDWLDERVVDGFVQYAAFLFQTFPEIKNWITVNVPFTFCWTSYRDGIHAPGVKSAYKEYICGHIRWHRWKMPGGRIG
jgi:beta-glucosidase